METCSLLNGLESSWDPGGTQQPARKSECVATAISHGAEQNVLMPFQEQFYYYSNETVTMATV